MCGDNDWPIRRDDGPSSRFHETFPSTRIFFFRFVFFFKKLASRVPVEHEKKNSVKQCNQFAGAFREKKNQTRWGLSCFFFCIPSESSFGEKKNSTRPLSSRFDAFEFSFHFLFFFQSLVALRRFRVPSFYRFLLELANSIKVLVNNVVLWLHFPHFQEKSFNFGSKKTRLSKCTLSMEACTP